jgi:hypothetical protein
MSDHVCLWGATNGYVDCAGGHEYLRDFAFCEVHADCVESMDDDEATRHVRSLVDTLDHRGEWPRTSLIDSPETWAKHQFEYENCAECGGGADDHDIIEFIGGWFARCKTAVADG